MNDRKKIVAIVGNANIDNSTKKQKLAFKMGKSIIDNGYYLVTGGMGGVMEYASKGARKSKFYKEGSILGIIPSYEKNLANRYIDIIIPTGMGLARNNLLIATSDAVISIGGGSGTLNEISSAWQMKKLIISLKSDGWSEILKGKALDERRSDKIFYAKNTKNAIKILNNNIDKYSKQYYNGINAKA